HYNNNYQNSQSPNEYQQLQLSIQQLQNQLYQQQMQIQQQQNIINNQIKPHIKPQINSNPNQYQSQPKMVQQRPSGNFYKPSYLPHSQKPMPQMPQMQQVSQGPVKQQMPPIHRQP